MENIKDLVIDQFIKYSKIPHPSRNAEMIISYLQDYVTKMGYVPHIDQYDNFYFDVPATKGYEKAPGIILQAHTDMVCVSEDPNYDFNNKGIEVLIKDNIMMANKTSLGADNGLGLAMILALIKTCKEHGKIRVLLTSDEEVGLLGASKLKKEVFTDYKYLINTDYETVNTICYGNAGNLRFHLLKPIKKIKLDSHCYLNVKLSNLIGGHSGMDIDKNRLNAIKVLFEMLCFINASGIKINIIDFSIGSTLNAIPFVGNISLAIHDDHLDETCHLIDEYFIRLKEQSMEDFKYEISKIAALEAMNDKDSSDLINLVHDLPYGALSFIDDVVETSINPATLNLKDNVITFGLSTRSCNNFQIDKLIIKFKKLASKYHFKYQKIIQYPGYLASKDTPLIKLGIKAYQDLFNINPKLTTIHAGFECSWFYKIKPSLEMIALGPTIHNPHSTSESVEIDSIKPTMEVLDYLVRNINKIGE